MAEAEWTKNYLAENIRRDLDALATHGWIDDVTLLKIRRTLQEALARPPSYDDGSVVAKQEVSTPQPVVSQSRQIIRPAAAAPSGTATAAAAASSAPVVAAERIGVALYDNEPEEKEDLAFNIGDEIVITDIVDAYWLRGTCKGRQGIFPASYVEEKTLTPPSRPKPPKKVVSNESRNSGGGSAGGSGRDGGGGGGGSSSRPVPKAKARSINKNKGPSLGQKAVNNVANGATRGLGFGFGGTLGAKAANALF